MARRHINTHCRDLPGSPVVKISFSNVEGGSLIPGQVDPTCFLAKTQKKIKQKQYCNKFKKGFKNDLLQKKS